MKSAYAISRVGTKEEDSNGALGGSCMNDVQLSCGDNVRLLVHATLIEGTTLI